MNFASFDLRLLNVFDAVFSERSMSRAAKRLSLTQPAVSNAIARLRRHLNDDLFVRSSEGLVPTSRATEIAQPIQEALSQLQHALTLREFRPETVEQTFRFAVSSNVAPLLLPTLQASLRKRAPGVNIMVQEKRNSMITGQLDAAEIDFAIGILEPLSSRFETQILYADRIVCAVRSQKGTAVKRMTMEAYLSAQHLSVYPGGGGVAQLDAHFEQLGITRRTSLSMFHLLLMPGILSRSGIVLTGFESIIKSHPIFAKFKMLELPIGTDPAAITIAWHRGRGRDPGQEWFRNLVIGILKGNPNIPIR